MVLTNPKTLINVIIIDEELDNSPIDNSPSIIAFIAFLSKYLLLSSIVTLLRESAQSFYFLSRISNILTTFIFVYII